MGRIAMEPPGHQEPQRNVRNGSQRLQQHLQAFLGNDGADVAQGEQLGAGRGRRSRGSVAQQGQQINAMRYDLHWQAVEGSAVTVGHVGRRRHTGAGGRQHRSRLPVALPQGFGIPGRHLAILGATPALLRLIAQLAAQIDQIDAVAWQEKVGQREHIGQTALLRRLDGGGHAHGMQHMGHVKALLLHPALQRIDPCRGDIEAVIRCHRQR